MLVSVRCHTHLVGFGANGHSFGKILVGSFPGGPMAKTLHFQCRCPSAIPGQGTGSHMSQVKLLNAATIIDDPVCCS